MLTPCFSKAGFDSGIRVYMLVIKRVDDHNIIE